MRRKDRERDAEFAREVIDRSGHGVVSFCGEGGEPYCVPLSLVRIGDELYFHCAREGRKLDLLRRNPRVCVCFVGRDEPAAEDAVFTTYFQSAVAEGTAYEVTDPERKIRALRALCGKLTPGGMGEFDRAVEKSLAVTAVWAIRMERLTGKEKARRA